MNSPWSGNVSFGEAIAYALIAAAATVLLVLAILPLNFCH